MIYLLQGPSAAVGTVSGFLDLGTFPPDTNCSLCEATD